ncbi:MAG: MOSC N-terminal beta barrel domain-containing protein [Pseudomonadota bacterium]
MGRLAEIWRHPLKGIGAERIAKVLLTRGEALPHDRVWALAHGTSDFDPAAPAWEKRKNFVVQAMTPELARVALETGADGTLTLSHPAQDSVSVAPGTEAGAAALAAWIEGLAGERQPGPYRVAHVPGRAMTDMPQPYVSILSLASMRALGQHAGAALHIRRFRGNLWLDDLAPWEEEAWIDRELTIGTARLRVDEPIGRCKATEANPATGDYDVPTVAELRRLRGHTEFGVYATVIEGGTIAEGDAVSPA